MKKQVTISMKKYEKRKRNVFIQQVWMMNKKQNKTAPETRLLIVPIPQLYCLPLMDKSGRLRRLLQPGLRIDPPLGRFMENTEAHKESFSIPLYVPL